MSYGSVCKDTPPRSIRRKPWENLLTTASELSRPSFIDVWFGDPHLEYKSDDGRVLRVEDRRVSEAAFLTGLGGAIWTTLKIATLGSLLAAVLGAPLGFLSAKNMHAPAAVAWVVNAMGGLAFAQVNVPSPGAVWIAIYYAALAAAVVRLRAALARAKEPAPFPGLGTPR